MNQHCSEPCGADRFGLPMAMAKDAAAIGRIDFDRFGDGGQAKLGPGKVVADDGLQVAILEPWMRLKRGEPGGDLRGRLSGRSSGND